MINPINQGDISPVQQNQAVSKKMVPKTDRRFQTFVDEALRENQQVEATKLKSSINISNHAMKRMEQRGIELDEADMLNIEEAFVSLNSKGAENSLIIYNDLSLIASVKNRTIITASKSDEMREITNIDSAIVINKQK